MVLPNDLRDGFVVVGSPPLQVQDGHGQDVVHEAADPRVGEVDDGDVTHDKGYCS